jgi:hypothetical protein
MMLLLRKTSAHCRVMSWDANHGVRFHGQGYKWN